MMKMQNAGVWAGAAVLLYAIITFVQSLSLRYYSQLGPGPGFFPLWLSGILILLSLLYIWLSIKKEFIHLKTILPQGKAFWNVISVIVSLILFMIIVDYTGFITACTLLLIPVLWREFKWYSAIGISLLTSIILFYVFDSLLKVPLPVNLFGW